MSRPMPSIGAQLRAIRLNAKLRQDDLARLIDVSQATISHVERGGVTSTDIVEKWAATCKAEVLISGGFYAELEAAVQDLDSADRDRLLRLARSLPVVMGPAKDGIILALEQLAATAAPRN